ncbi:MAG TPA: Dabb family protein, partial [Acidobacteriota bacterium]
SSSPGVKNLWMKSLKIQPREYSQTFVIEFENEAALKAYAEHPKKKEWDDFYYSIRETSLNSVTTN